MKIDGARVLVTGASRGIGSATAVALANHGASVALAARRAEALEEVARGIRESGHEAHLVVADVAIEEEVRRMVAEASEKLGGIDILVNNAGIGLPGPVAEIKPADLRYVFEVNVLAPLVATQLVVPAMVKRRSGHVVNVGSVASHVASPDLGGYSSSKFALKALTDSLRMELQGTRVAVTLVSPGPIATEFSTHSRGRYPDHYPKRPVGAPAEAVARAIVRAIERRLPEVFVPAYYQELVGLNAMVPQIFRAGGRRGMRVGTWFAERFL